MAIRTTLIGTLAVIVMVGMALVGKADAGSRYDRGGYQNAERHDSGRRASSRQGHRYKVDRRRGDSRRFRHGRKHVDRRGHRHGRRNYHHHGGRHHYHAAHYFWTGAVLVSLPWLLTQ